MNKEYVIIGWGLAGAILAWQAYFRDKSFSVYDSGINHSSRVAAGLVNPIVFKRLTKSWQADVLMPVALSFYQRVEKELGVELISNNNLYRVFASVEEQNNWASKQGDDRFSKYLSSPTDFPNAATIDAPFGFGMVETFGGLDTITFLDESKTFFKGEGVSFVEQRFDYDSIKADFSYFFCEGSEVKNNPLFNYLPLKPTHGETLIIESESYQFKPTINKNMFLMAMPNGKYKVGSTYNWELQEPVITAAAKNDLVERLAVFVKFPYKVVKQEAGIRPTVSDRRPLIGQHHEIKNSYIFNGLGAKGVMIAPHHALGLLDFVAGVSDLDSEVNIERYNKLL